MQCPTVIGSAFPQTLVDDYIVPMINSGSQDFSGLFQAIVRLVGILAVGVVAIFAYNRIMVNISQGTMRHLRDDLFHKMESLPIKYFDTHAHGDIMSVYTNDVDTLRQMISQSIPQIINTVITMIATLITMLVLNPVLTIIPVVTAIIMLLVTSKLAGRSGNTMFTSREIWAQWTALSRKCWMARKWSRYSAMKRLLSGIFVRLMMPCGTALTKPTGMPTF